MSRRKPRWKWKYAAIAAGMAVIAVLLFINRDKIVQGASLPPPSQKGYKAEDRHQLEQLINTGTKND